MKQITLKAEPFSKDDIPKMLKDHGICINHYAREYFSHPEFSVSHSGEMALMIASLREIGLEDGAALSDIFKRIPELGLRPCRPCAGLMLRIAWTDQPRSRNSVLSGTHEAPDRAVTVLSEALEDNDDFPKGLYLRNVDGDLWLRGYICGAEYRFDGDATFAFEQATDSPTLPYHSQEWDNGT